MMRINVEDAPAKVREEDDLLGNVYKVEGGGRAGPRAQMVVARGGDTCYTVTFSLETGELTATGSAGYFYFQRKQPIGKGRVSDIIAVEWY